MIRFKCSKIQAKLEIGFIAIAMITSALLTLSLFIATRRQIRQDTRKGLYKVVSIAALQIDGDSHAQLRNKPDQSKPQYSHLQKKLSRILEAGENFEYVYTWRFDEKDRLVFVGDAPTEDEETNYIGEPYESADASLTELLMNMDGPAVDQDFTHDQWGTFLSGYAPFYTSDGQLEGILGIDIDASDVKAKERQFLILAVLVFLVTIPFAAVAARLLGRKFAKPIIELTKATEHLKQGRLDYRVTLKCDDELKQLAESFNNMAIEIEHQVSERTRRLQHEIAIRRKVEKKIAKAKSRAEAANRAKSEFLANMSHEIRTPMNSIIGFSDLLTAEDLTETQLDFVTTINDSAKHLLDLINDILDFSKIESGKHKIEIIDCQLSDIFDKLHSLLAIKAAEKNIEFKINRANTLPENIRTDPTRLTQCLINLVNNSIKFTEKGHVHVNVTPQINDNKSYIQFDVKDTGIGIPPDRQEAIFDAFTQADGSTTRKYGGTGLGLAITRQLAELMGGIISVKSTVGQGSTFSLVIPTAAENIYTDAGTQAIAT